METNRKYNIIFRACDLVLAVNKNPRPFDLKKAELIKICFLSLLDSLKGVDTKIIVLGDKLSEEMIHFFKRFDVELRLGNFGNEASIQETFKIASTLPEHEWIYFCEDDYLHIPYAFSLIDNFIEQGNELFAQKMRWYNASSFYNIRDKDLFIYPSDYPDRYTPKFRKHSLIVVSSDCHWRQINSVTFTFLTKVSTVKKYFGLFMKSSEKARDRMFSRKLFGRVGWGFWTSSVCFSPLPGLSTHMHRDTMTPLIKWDKLIEEYKNRIKELNY